MPKRIPLEGKRFGKLYVKSYIGNGKYHCLCDCQKECDVFATNLTSNHTTSCGCKKTTLDLGGRTFGYLKVIKRTEGKLRGKRKVAMWECVCMRCGKKKSVYADCLLSGKTTSCGCLAEERDMPQKIKDSYINGTQVSKILSKPTKSNKTGVVGVNWDKSRNKWQASIRFQGRKYNLGRFEDFEVAVKIRKEAEKQIFGEFLDWYNDISMQKEMRYN